MPGYYIWTIGCQMNKAESERLGSYFEQLGYTKMEDAETADVVLLNSCVVRQHAENKVVNKLNTIKGLKKRHPGMKLALTGCIVPVQIDEIKKRFPFVDYFVRPGEFLPCHDNNGKKIIPLHPSISTYVTIMRGCNNYCAYCIVPYRRGNEKSRNPAEIIQEVRTLVARGSREVILLGQNVNSYGHDLNGKPDLADLLAAINDIEGLVRLRFLTNHPKDMTVNLIKAIARFNKVCPDINLPVQAGDNEILKMMNRGYNVEHYREVVADLRAAVPGLGLTTDVIVGFPSETAVQFDNTVALLTELRFDGVHVAAYSPRKGTKAEREFNDDVPVGEKKRRVAIIETLQARIASEINGRLLGREVEILVEGKNNNKWYGRTPSGKLVFFQEAGNCSNKLIRVKITKTSSWSLQGEVARYSDG